MRYDAVPKVINKLPSRAYVDSRGQYVPCPDNQPQAFKEFQEKNAKPKGSKVPTPPR